MTIPAYRPLTRSRGRGDRGALKALAAITLVVSSVPVGAWWLLLLVGIVHAWWPLVPTMPFTVAFVIAATKLLFVVGATVVTEAVKAVFE
jgi:CHASE2 domain-containing sensor protein